MAGRQAASCCWRRRAPTPTTRPPPTCIPVGTLAQVLQLLKLPDGTIKVLVEGTARVNAING